MTTRSRPVVTAAFATSWDGRLLEVIAPPGRVDAHRAAFSGGPARFRRLCAEGLVDEIFVTWRPCIGGGTPITGLPGRFLPRGITLDLVKLRHRGEECVARYRVQAAPL